MGKNVELNDDILSGMKFRQVNDDWTFELTLGKYLVLIYSNGWYYPAIEQTGELSSETMQVVHLNRIKYVYTLKNLIKTLKHEDG